MVPGLFVPRWDNWALQRARGNCSYLPEPPAISKRGREYKEQRGLYSLQTWWQESFSAFFSHCEERKYWGNSLKGQKFIQLNQISVGFSCLL